MGKAAEEGQGPSGAGEPMMVMMMMMMTLDPISPNIRRHVI